MFWKHRNSIGIVLLIVASLLWAVGRNAIVLHDSESMETTVAGLAPSTTAIAETLLPTAEPTLVTTDPNPSTAVVVDPSIDPGLSGMGDPGAGAGRGFGITACVVGVITALCGIFVVSQRRSVLGPDGLSALWFAGSWGFGYFLYRMGGFSDFFTRFFGVFLLLLTLRILWGWCLSRFSGEQCLLHRLCKHLPGEGFALLLIVGWTLVSMGALWIYGAVYGYSHNWVTYCSGGATILFGLFFLLRYTVELQHFRKQLERYRMGLPIEVKDGAFAQTEEQLRRIREEHEEAVHTAVVGERFKVDLIANVSHDLRTPLTSILGYSELLNKEELSPKGREQLKRLQEKSVYMNELVEALFELTKVESGAIEPKKEPLDLVRLLEQTVGFLDDRLQETALEVRRRYAADRLWITSDGGLLHQVFVNLLSNAIKYALPGSRIYLDLRDGEDGILVRMVNTANYDMDFSEEEILERFARGDKARSTRGSGIGLAIAKTYAEAVGGTFRVKVDGDQFSAFITLPKN